jgi:photosystem II stability/assembly factor-like uncharacterized protein
MVLPCDAVSAVGVWEQITPAAVTLECFNPPPGFCGNAGTVALVADPKTSGRLYLGTSQQGLFRSDNCGSTWTKVNTGVNGVNVGAATTYYLEIDPSDPEVLYAPAQNDQIFKSVNGGTDWTQVWPPDATVATNLDTPIVDRLTLDATDSKHLIVTMKYLCKGGYAPNCLGESTDGGLTWSLRKLDPAMTGEGGSAWMLSASVWVWSNGASGFWRSTDTGATWLQLAASGVGEARSRLYRSTSGAFFLGGTSGVLESTDGIGWSLIPSSGQSVVAVVGDGKSIVRSDFGVCFHWGTNMDVYNSAPDPSGTPWSPYPMGQPFTQGAVDMVYDADHHLLYGSMCQDGLWRLRTQ